MLICAPKDFRLTHMKEAKAPAVQDHESHRTDVVPQLRVRERHGESGESHSQRSSQRSIDQSPVVQRQRARQEMIEHSPRVRQQHILQQQIAASPRVRQQKAAISQQQAPSNTAGLPEHLKAGIESLSGMSMDAVSVHYNCAQPAQMQAHAYAQGTEIHLAPGQERHLPHEAWHVVQQAQGRVSPTRQLKGAVPINDDEGLEQEADAMGARALQLGDGAQAQEPQPLPTASMSGPMQRVDSDDESEDAPDPEPALDLSTLPKLQNTLTIGAATEAAKTGNLIDRILHEVAVRVAAIFEEEVPFDARNLSLDKLKAQAIVSVESKRKQKAALQERAKVKKGSASATSASDKKPVEPSPQDEARERLKADEGSGQRLNAPVTQILVQLQHLRRLYMSALLGESSHPRGSNVFSWCDIDFVVKAKGRYVAPLTGDKVGKAGQPIPLEDSDFNAYDYPRNELSHKDFKVVIEDLLAGDTPQLDVRRLTTFIAAIGAEISRYEPQIVSVVLALSGVTADIDTQKSVFTAGLTMTTGSTDPGSGSHVDNRPGFAGQPGANRATEPAAIREGAILRAALSHPELKLDVATYLGQKVAALGASPSLADCGPIIDELAQMLIYIINRKSAKSVQLRQPQSARLEDHLTAKALKDHFPENFEFPARSVGESSIVLLSAGDRARLAMELSRHDWAREFRSVGQYDVATTKDHKNILYGKANIRLTNQDGPDKTAKNGNHWSGHDWAGGHKKLSVAEFKKAIEAKQGEVSSERAPRAPLLKPHERISELYRLLEGKEDKDKRALNERLGRILASLDENGNLDAVQGEVSALEGELSERDANLQALLLGSQPSNEWGLMPRSWQRHEASGLGHNCLIDSLLQHVTALNEGDRRGEAAAIRQQLIREGRTRPLEYLSAHDHATRVLQLIGVDPSQYEVRTEWTSGGLAQLRETVNAGGPQVIRLWNTGGHYEPITVNVDNPLVDDIDVGQSNTPTLRAAQPLWLTNALGNADDEAVAELEKEEAATDKGDGATRAGYVQSTVDGRNLYTFPGAKPPTGETRYVLREPKFNAQGDNAALKVFLDTYEIPYADVTIYTATHRVIVTGVQSGDPTKPYTFQATKLPAPAKKKDTAAAK